MLAQRWKQKENRRQQTVAAIAAGFAGSGEVTDFLPFPPPRRYMTIEETERALERFARSMGAEIISKPWQPTKSDT